MTRFLLVRLGSLGDVVHAIPAAAALRTGFPDAQIDWVVDPRYVELLSLVRGLNRSIPLDSRTDPRAIWHTIRSLRTARYDVAIDFQGLIKSGTVARVAGAPVRIGFPRAHLREPAARFFYTQTPDPGAARHVIAKNLSLLAAVGVTTTAIDFPLDIPRGAAVDALLTAAGSEGYALINPGAAWPNKRWPPDRFGAVAAALRERYAIRSAVLWGPGEESLAAAVVAASAGSAAVAPPTTIPDLFALSQRAALLVSGDTGPLHIAAAVGTPIVALFGPTWSDRNGPWSPADVTIARTETCVCLYERRCRRPPPCIDEITVAEVVSAIDRRLGAHA